MSKGTPAPPPQELTEEMKKLVEENAKLTAEVKRLHEQITLAQIEHGVKVVIRPFDYPAGYDPNAVNTQQVAKNKKEQVEQKVEVKRHKIQYCDCKKEEKEYNEQFFKLAQEFVQLITSESQSIPNILHSRNNIIKLHCERACNEACEDYKMALDDINNTIDLDKFHTQQIEKCLRKRFQNILDVNENKIRYKTKFEDFANNLLIMKKNLI